MPLRKIIRIDEEKCDGCGKCVPACAEGALRIIEGKARLVSESYCDGMGACLGDCPQKAIIIEEREASEYDAAAVERHLRQDQRPSQLNNIKRERPSPSSYPSCPGSLAQSLGKSGAGRTEKPNLSPTALFSRLNNWPVQLMLAPVNAPYFQKARLLIAADCVPFALADFHASLLEGKILLIGCPKLDDLNFYREKLTAIFRENIIMEAEVAYMEVPCCFGLVQAVKQAIAESGKAIPLTLTRIGIRGEIREKDKPVAKMGEGV